eukprot:COSAG01_NODE_5758_length_4053_cov_12.093576_5_plen_95_part_00
MTAHQHINISPDEAREVGACTARSQPREAPIGDWTHEGSVCSERAAALVELRRGHHRARGSCTQLLEAEDLRGAQLDSAIEATQQPPREKIVER